MIFVITDLCSQRVAEAYFFFSILRTDTLMMLPKNVVLFLFEIWKEIDLYCNPSSFMLAF